jgi:hypothetical protein
MSDDPQLRKLKIILYGHLEKCKIPLTRNDWAGFVKELDKLNVRELFFGDWIKQEQKRFDRLTKSGLFQDRINDSLILALYQLYVLRPKAEVYDKECVNWWAHKTLHDESLREKWLEQEAKKKRDRKPKAPGVTKNWLEPMPIFNEGEPCGYVQATGQRRKVIEDFLRHIRAKPEKTLTKKQRGKPASLYGFETNCRVLEQWLKEWCDQRPEQKHDIVLKEALLLAELVAKSKSSVNEKRLARVRQIFITHARSAAKQNGTDSSFDFLASASACREKFPPPVPVPAWVSNYATGWPSRG